MFSIVFSLLYPKKNIPSIILHFSMACHSAILFHSLEVFMSHGFLPAHPHSSSPWAWWYLWSFFITLDDVDSGRWCPWCCGWYEQIHMNCRSLVEKRDSMAELWVREHLDPCLERLLLLSGSITTTKFLIHYARFALGDYLLQITKKRMLLITTFQ